MTLHGVVLSIAAGIGTLYAVWWAAERNNDGPLLGWVLAALVLVGGLLWAAGL